MAMQGQTETLYKSLSRRFFQGTFPVNMGNLSMEDFSRQYRVPIDVLHSVLKEGIQEESQLGGADLRGALEAIRSRMLDSSLFQYGATTARLYRLTQYLEARVYRSQATDPTIIRELNVALSNSFKGIDSSAKILSLLNDALVTTPETFDPESQQLTRSQIIEILSQNQPPSQLTEGSILPQMDLALMAEQVKDTPSLAPIKEGNTLSLVPLQPTQGNYLKKPDIKNTEIPEKLVTLPT